MLECKSCDRANWGVGNGNKNEISKDAEMLPAVCNKKHDFIILPASLISKLFNFEVPTLQPSQTNPNLAIRFKGNQQLVGFNSCNKNKWYVNYLCPFFPFTQWTQWRTVMIHRLLYHSFYWLKTDRGMSFIFKSEQIFFISSCATVHVQTSVWTELFQQVHRNC